MFVPVLFRPRLLSFKNSFRLLVRERSQPGREVGILFFALFLFFLVYRGATIAFTHFRGNAALASLDPALPLGLFLGLLSGMILLSSCAAALGAFYLGHDLELILSKPISFFRLFSGRALETICQSAWMILVFTFPTLVAMGQAYGAPLSFYLIAVVTIIPFLAIPCFLGIIAILFFVRILPPHRARDILFVGAGVLIIGSYFSARLFIPAGDEGTQGFEQIDNLLTILDLSQSPFLPSFWTAYAITRPLTTGSHLLEIVLPIVLLYLVFLAVATAAFLIFRLWFYRSFSEARSSIQGVRIKSSRAQARLIRFTPYLSQHGRALWAKEMKLFTRDITQAVQLLLLLGICLVYLYNFKVVNRIGNLPDEAQLWWKGALTICNTGMGAFVMTAVSTRFVFSSLSLEGNSFWILQSAPLTLGEVLKIKFWSWYVPLAAISSVILASGALAIDAEPHIVWITALGSWVLAYGIVGLAIGLGALFANFQWESTSQISASFGSLVYMLAGSMLVFLDIIPITIIIVCRTLRESGVSFSPAQWYMCIASTTFLLVYLNFAVTRWALRLGEQSLAESRRPI